MSYITLSIEDTEKMSFLHRMSSVFVSGFKEKVI
jgi:hypothetical protein